jgi:hypothetical protein
VHCCLAVSTGRQSAGVSRVARVENDAQAEGPRRRRQPRRASAQVHLILNASSATVGILMA